MTTHYHPVIGAKKVHYRSVELYQQLEKETGKVQMLVERLDEIFHKESVVSEIFSILK